MPHDAAPARATAPHGSRVTPARSRCAFDRCQLPFVCCSVYMLYLLEDQVLVAITIASQHVQHAFLSSLSQSHFTCCPVVSAVSVICAGVPSR
jgi:hypothetical protein